MSFWMPMALPLAVTVLWVLIPGLLATSMLRLQPTMRWALAPMVSLGIIASAAIAAPFVELPWGPLPVILVTVALTLLLWAVRILAARPAGGSWKAGLPALPRASGDHPDRPERGSASARDLALRLLSSREALTALGLALAAVLMAWQLRSVLVHPDAISQTYDNIHHLSLVRWFLDHQNASMLTAGGMSTGADPGAFYPALWHAVIALAMVTTGSPDIPLYTNAMAITVCALLWPGGALLLTRTLLPSSLQRWGIIPAAVMLTAIPMFPLLLIDFGVLYPNLLGLSLIPALLIPVARFLGVGRTERMSLPAVLLLGVLGSAGTAFAHPNAAMSLLVLAVAVGVAAALIGIVRVLTPALRSRGNVVQLAVTVSAAALITVIMLTLWPLLRPSSAALTWLPFASVAEAVGEALLGAAQVKGTSLVLGVIVLLGLYGAIRHRRLVVLALWVTAMHLWIVVAAWPDGLARDAVVGPWFNDPFRLAAILGIAMALLTALGAAHLGGETARLITARLGLVDDPVHRGRRTRSGEDSDAAQSVAPRAHRRGAVSAAVSLVLAAVLIPITQTTPSLRWMIDQAHGNYRLDDESELLTADEYALIQRIPDEIPEDSVVLVDAWNGSALLYPLTGIRTTEHHVTTSGIPPRPLIHRNLDDLHYMPEVCAAIHELGATYALDFGRQQINDGMEPRPGWFGLTENRGFEEVDREGSAVLYRIPPC